MSPHYFVAISSDGLSSYGRRKMSPSITKAPISVVKAPISKALRIKDAVWGAFDTPSNLLAVCDACYDAGRRELTSD